MITEKVQSSVYAQYWSKNLACVSLPSDCGVGPDWYETIWSQDVSSSGSLLSRALIFLPFSSHKIASSVYEQWQTIKRHIMIFFCISVIHFGINPLLTGFSSLVNKIFWTIILLVSPSQKTSHSHRERWLGLCWTYSQRSGLITRLQLA